MARKFDTTKTPKKTNFTISPRARALLPKLGEFYGISKMSDVVEFLITRDARDKGLEAEQ